MRRSWAGRKERRATLAGTALGPAPLGLAHTKTIYVSPGGSSTGFECWCADDVIQGHGRRCAR